MRNLVALAVAVEVDTVPGIRTLSKDQFLPAPTDTGEGAFPVVSTVVKLEDRLRGFWKPQTCSRILRAQDNQ